MAKRILVLLTVAAMMAAILALSAGAALPQAESETVTSKIPVPFGLSSPCTGESITGTGTLTFISHSTQDTQGGEHNFLRISLDGTGVGTISGTQYRVIQSQTGPAIFTGASTTTVPAKVRLISADGTDNFYQDTLVHITFDHDGTPTAVVETIDFGECLG